MDVLKQKRFAGKTPEPERRKQRQHRDPQKLRTESTSANCGGGTWGKLLPSSSKISQESTVVRMDEKLHAKQLAGGPAHTHNRG